MTDEMKEEENNVGISFKKSYEELEKENEELKEQIEKLKCCENSTTTLSGEFISCSLQEEKAALQEAVDKLEANSASKDECIDNLEYNLKDAGGELELWQRENAELKNVVKLLIATLNDTTWDEGHPGYADSEPHYNCPDCSCKDCYRASCKHNKSELFKKLYKELPELYENKSGQN